MDEAEAQIATTDRTGADNNTSLLAGDILRGADEIAEFLFGDRKQRRKVYNLVETARLPVFRLGINICARKSVLIDWIANQERMSSSVRPHADDGPSAPAR